MKALKLLASSLVAVGMLAAPHDADAANAKNEKMKASHSSFRDTAYTKRVMPERSWKSFAGFDSIARPQTKTALHGNSFRNDAEPAAGAGTGKGVPELSGSAAGASLALVFAGVLALTGRRKRKTQAQ